MPVFRQKPNGLNLVMGIGFIICALLFSVPLLILFIRDFDPNELTATPIVIISAFGAVSLSLILASFIELEWFIIYEDKIIARNIFKIKKIVYYKNVSSINEALLGYNRRSDSRSLFYVFNELQNSMLESYSTKDKSLDNYYTGFVGIINNKNSNLRIQKTLKLKKFLLEKFPNKIH